MIAMFLKSGTRLVERFRSIATFFVTIQYEFPMKHAFVYLMLLGLLLASCSKKDSTPKEKVLYQANFDKDDGNWSLDDYDSITVSLAGGNYQIENHKFNYLWEELTNPVFDTLDNHIALEMRFTMTKDPDADYGGGGLLWHADASNGNIAYFFDIYTDGYYEIFGYPDGQTYKQYASEDASKLIKSDGANVLRITLVDQALHFILNGSEVFSMKAIGSGLDVPGVATEGQSTIKVDYFKAIQLP